MKIAFVIPAMAAALLTAAAARAQTGFPFQNETLRYSVNWPSGLSLGDASMTAVRSGSKWAFDLSLDAGIPGFPVADRFHSSATSEPCSLELRRETSHGGRKSSETTTFDQAKGTARRTTTFPEGGGSSDLSLPACGRDALAFVYYGRRELGQGRVPAPQQVYFGGPYSARMDYTGAVTIQSGDKPAVTDHLVVSVKGPKSDFTFEVFYARDAARTPLLVKIPLPVGSVSVELVR
jgi:hypothetical protein